MSTSPVDVPQRREPWLSPRNWRLGTSLTVTLAVLLILLVVVAFATYREVLTERHNAEIDNSVAFARTLAAEVDRFVADLETTTLAVALVLGHEGIPLDQPTIGPYLKRIVQDYGFIRALFVTDLEGHVIATASGEGLGLDLSTRPYLQVLMAGSPAAWSDAIPGLQTGQATVAFGRVIQSRGGRVRGYLVAAFYPIRLVARLQATMPRDAAITLIDRHGIVMHTTYEPAPPPEQRDLSSFPLVQEALSGKPVRIEGQGLPFSREPRYGALVPVTSNGWVVVVSRPLVPLEARIRAPSLRQGLVLALAWLLAAAIFLFVARRLIRPLERLATSAASIARGERPEISPVLGGVETTQLAAGMRSMLGAIAEREDALRGAYEGERAARAVAEQAQARMAFLTEASTLLAGSLDYEITLRNVAHLAVPRFADWCTVDLVDDNGRIERLAVAHVDPTKVALAYEMQRRYPPDPVSEAGVAGVIRSGKPLLIPEITDEMLQAGAQDAEHLHILREVGLTSGIIVPLTARGQTFGAMVFVWAESGRRYGEADLALALDIARRAAVAIDNSRMFHRERNIAETLQRSLLRKRLPQIPGMRIASRYLPARQAAEVGGDWYDALALSDGRIALVMGDVAGRGVEAAAVMGQLQNAVRAYALEGHRPVVVLERVARLLDLREMATLLYLVFDPAAWTVQYASAGHLPPMVIAPDGSVSLLEGSSAPLGGPGDVVFREEHTTLAPGSTIVLYTDGLIEVRGESLDHGLDRLMQAALHHSTADPEVLLDHLLASLLGTEAAADDVALLALHALALDPALLRLQLEATPPSLPLLRYTLRRWLEQSHVGADEIFEISVAASEAFANAVEHAYGAADASVEVEAAIVKGELVISVRDRGQWRPPRGAHRGRGMALMRGLMDDVQVAPGPDGTMVQLRRRLRREVLA